MKDQRDPVTDDEYVFRRVLNRFEYYDPSLAEPFLYTAFLPASRDADGLSMYREACGADARAIISSGANPTGYVVVRFSVKELNQIGLTVVLVCSPKLLPPDMRVFTGPIGPGDSQDERQEAHARADHRQAS